MRSKIQAGFGNISTETIILVLLFLVTLILISPSLFPSYQEINPHDETKYVDSGRMLIDGLEIRELGRSPIVSLIYGAVYLFVSRSLDWFILSVWIGRIILFTILWISTIFLGLRFRDSVHPYILAGVLFLSPAILVILGNPGDSMFAAMSAITLAKTIDFYRSNDLKDLAIASMFMGLSFASRPDGLFLSPIFLVIALVIGFKKVPFFKLLAASILPGLLVVSVFLLLRFLTTGNFRTGIGEKAYGSIGWGVVTSTEEGTVTLGAEDFGSAEDNRGNVLIAFSRYPQVFLQRVLGNSRGVVDTIIQAYGGKKITPLILLFGFAGVVALLLRKSYALLIMLFLWPIPAGLYLAFYLREGFFLLSFYIPLLLTGIGVAYVFSVARKRTERLIILGVLILFTAYAFLDSKPAFVAVGIVVLSAFLLAWAIHRLYDRGAGRELSGLFLALVAGLILHPPFPFPPIMPVGETSQEKAVRYLQENFKRGTGVGTFVPLPALAARMDHHLYPSLELDQNGSLALMNWMDNNDIEVLFVEPALGHALPGTMEVIEADAGTRLERVFLADPGSVQIFIVQE